MQSNLDTGDTLLFIAFIISFFTVIALAHEVDTLKARDVKNDQNIRR